MITLITKEQFLIEHNKLSPANLQATLALLDRFKEEKKPLLGNNAWSIEKLRIPFITWLLNLPPEEREKTISAKKSDGPAVFASYPQTKP